MQNHYLFFYFELCHSHTKWHWLIMRVSLFCWILVSLISVDLFIALLTWIFLFVDCVMNIFIFFFNLIVWTYWAWLILMETIHLPLEDPKLIVFWNWLLGSFGLFFVLVNFCWGCMNLQRFISENWFNFVFALFIY